MATMNGMPEPQGSWQEARAEDGRVYYYNKVTKKTQWTKPLDLLSPAERELAIQAWEEYTTKEGKKYWANKMTKESSWTMPEAYQQKLAQAEAPSRPAMPAPQFVAGGTSSMTSFQKDDFGDRLGPERQIGYGGNDMNGGRGPTVTAPENADPNYNTFEEAEAAFIKLLRRSNVQPDWSWEQTMRATIKDPQYRALKDPKDRKAAFEKYAVDVRIQEKDRAKERLAKLRQDFGKMLKSHPEIKHHTRWKTARPIIEGETIFRSTSDDTERRQLFEEYIIDLKKANIEREAITRKSAMDELVGLLKALDLEPYTRWSEAQETIQSNDKFQADDKFKTLSKSDILTAFENHIKSLERTFNDERQKEKNLRQRRERQNRDDFQDLLRELKDQGKIKAGTKWMDVQPLIHDDSRYVAILGQVGSTPLDLFWDMVEEEERALRFVRNDVYDVLEDKRYEITPKTTFEQFTEVMSTDRRTSNLTPDTLTLIFDRLLEKVIRRNEDDKHASERHQRRLVDALRSKIKHLDRPPVTSGTTWDDLRPQISHFEEFKALESDDLRKQAFDKVQRRLKEKEDDIEAHERHTGSSRHHRDSVRDRGREREPRNGYSRHSDRRRTPELDVYEAERRKAMADRERQYHKSGTTGLSPPPPHARSRERERERGDRGARLPRDYDRDHRRERDDLYRSRADPRGGRDELDYGDQRGGSGRRRRADSEGESVGSARKRPRRERRKTPPTPKVVEAKKEEVAVHSGSEEGEMVEEE